MRKVEQTESVFWNIIQQVFMPMVIYYVVSNCLVFLGFAAIQSWENLFGMIEENILFYMETFVKMAGMALGGLMVLPYFKREKQGKEPTRLSGFVMFGLILVGGILSLGINYIFFVSGFTQSSEQYQQVAESQFALPLWLACIFYGILSPVVEETVFRGIVYCALRRNIGKTMAIVGSAFCFGIFHGNMVQMVYAGLMGGVLAYIYQKHESLLAPVLVHGAANIAIYIATLFISSGV